MHIGREISRQEETKLANNRDEALLIHCRQQARSEGETEEVRSKKRRNYGTVKRKETVRG